MRLYQECDMIILLVAALTILFFIRFITILIIIIL